MTMDSQKFCLKWDGFHGNVTSLFDNLRQNDELVDITLCCEGQRVRAHKMMLSACSPYFRDLLKEIPCQQMAIFLKDTSAADLQAIVEFMYKGSVNVAQSQLASFIKTAEMLQIRGLSGDEEKAPAASSPARPRTVRPAPSPAPEPPPPPLAKRRRVSALAPAGSEAPPPQVIDCTLSPEPEPSPGDLSPSGACLSHHPLSSPQPSPSGSGAAASRALQPTGADSPVADPADPAPRHHPASQSEDCYVKVEKVEAESVDEDCGSLGAALEHVSEYEGTEAYSGEYPALTMDAHSGLDVSVAAGPVQRGTATDDGSQQGARVCPVCQRRYNSRNSFYNHMKVHQGSTQCSLCSRVLSTVPNLRDHLRSVHQLAADQVALRAPRTREW